jgi:hypothetical protein
VEWAAWQPGSAPVAPHRGSAAFFRRFALDGVQLHMLWPYCPVYTRGASGAVRVTCSTPVSCLLDEWGWLRGGSREKCEALLVHDPNAWRMSRTHMLLSAQGGALATNSIPRRLHCLSASAEPSRATTPTRTRPWFPPRRQPDGGRGTTRRRTGTRRRSPPDRAGGRRLRAGRNGGAAQRSPSASIPSRLGVGQNKRQSVDGHPLCGRCA